jgi:hypothetical protein
MRKTQSENPKTMLSTGLLPGLVPLSQAEGFNDRDDCVKCRCHCFFRGNEKGRGLFLDVKHTEFDLQNLYYLK